MQAYQRQFIQLAIDSQVLRFGHFTLKSGRTSPYFFNLGQIANGHALGQLGRAYAKHLIDQKLDIDMLFGPAYKGIPLVTTTAIALAEQHNLSLDVAYNRKEAKDHGEGGVIVGADVKGRVLILDDVITAGTAIRHSLALISQHQAARPAGVLVALDRMEKGPSGMSAIEEISQIHNIPVMAIVTLEDVLEYLASTPSMTSELTRMQAYRDQYGID